MNIRQGLLIVIWVLLAGSATAQQPTPGAVVDRLHSYLRDYALKLPATIASEHYEQRCTGNSVVQWTGNGHVVLESEFGIMRMERPAGWLGVRDVLSVNGKPVPDREERLQALFTDPSARTLEQARRIAQENARFNVGPIRRTINDPAVVLALLDDSYASRLRFTKGGDATIDGVGTWILKFDERERPTLIRTTAGQDQPAKGRVWVDPLTGRLMRAELTIEAPRDAASVAYVGFTATLVVEFENDARLGLWVPAKMTERYASLPCAGDATYTNYRTFGVQTRILSP